MNEEEKKKELSSSVSTPNFAEGMQNILLFLNLLTIIYGGHYCDLLTFFLYFVCVGITKFIDANTVEVRTPDFSAFQRSAPKESAQAEPEKDSKNSPREMTVEQPTMVVTVSCGNKIFSITSCPFDFFFPTKAERCIIFGPALLNGVVGGHEACFVIQTRDSMGNVRQVGGDEFGVVARRVNTIAENNETKFKAMHKKAQEAEREAINDGSDVSAIENAKGTFITIHRHLFVLFQSYLSFI